MNNFTWREVLAKEKQKEYFKNILKIIEEERSKGIVIYPKNSEIFNSLSLTQFSDVKVVIIGQDPYHGPHQAHGLSFSVQDGVPKPPSLVNIYKEIESDLKVKMSSSGNLTSWAKQGVLLLNASLSVKQGEPMSHSQIGWETFTNKIIYELNEKSENLIFLLWGSFAQKKGQIIDPKKHFILTAPHPSPLSAHRGFLGCKHFSKTNQILKELGKSEIDWQI